MTKIEEERFIQECKMKVLRIKNELNKHRDLRVANIEYALALKVDGEEFPAERAEWDYKTAVGVAQALAESKVSWVPSVMFGGGSSSNSAMDAVGLKMLLDITKSLEKTSK